MGALAVRVVDAVAGLVAVVVSVVDDDPTTGPGT